MSKKVMHKSPAGIGQYVFVKTPYTQHNPDGEFKANLIVDPNDAGVTEFLKGIKEAAQGGHTPYEKNDDGTVTVKFKSKYRPRVADENAKYYQEEDIPLVGNGSKIKVAYVMNHWDVSGKTGVSLYLQGLQILELVEYEGSMFEAEDEGEEVPAFNADDDMPF